LAAVTKKSSQVPPASSALPIAIRVTRSQDKASAEALTASAATGDPFTYAEAMESPQRDHWKGAMEEESTSILLINTFLLSLGFTVLSRSGTSIPRYQNPPKIPESVSVRKPVSPRISDDSAWNILTVSRYSWIPM
jgi:hypothetical protein